MQALDYRYKAKVVRVVDADTIDLTIDLGLRVSVGIRVRLWGLNAPEMRTLEGRVAKIFVESLLKADQMVTIKTFKDPRDKYGRWLAIVELADGSSLNQILLLQGFAVVMAE